MCHRLQSTTYAINKTLKPLDLHTVKTNILIVLLKKQDDTCNPMQKACVRNRMNGSILSNRTLRWMINTSIQHHRHFGVTHHNNHMNYLTTQQSLRNTELIGAKCKHK